jgi:capsule polysaccharide export protein KpsE/RkpR
LQGELIDGRSRVAALRQVYSEDSSKVRALEAHNAELQQQIDKMGGVSQPSGSSTNVAVSGFPTAHDLPTLGLTYYDLERRLRVEEALWEALTKQYEAASVEEAKETPTVHVLDPANVPGRKSRPVRRRIVLIGALISLALGFIAAFAVNIWEGMDPEQEPKKMLLDVTGAALEAQRWYWRLPGFKSIRSRQIR